MNNWLFFALSAPLMWAFTNIFDGALRKTFIKNDLALTWLSAAIRLPFVILFFLISGFSFPGAYAFAGIFISGLLWTLPMYFYYKALEAEDPSRISLLMQLVPIFTLPIAHFAINERLSSFQICAFVVLIFAGVFASLKKMPAGWRFSKAFFLIALSCLLWASSDVLFKQFATAFPDYLSAFSVDMLGAFMASFLLFFMPKSRIKVFESVRGAPLKAWLLVIASATLGIIGGLSFTYALTLGKVSLTSVLIGTQPLFVLVVGILLARFIRGLSKEDLGKEALIAKAVSFVLVIIGLVLLQL